MPLTTGKVTGKSAHGPSGGMAVGMGAPGHETPSASARTFALKRRPKTFIPRTSAVPRAPRPLFTPPPVAGPDNVSSLQQYLDQIGGPRSPTPFGFKDYPSRTGPSPIGQGSTHFQTSNFPPAGQMTIAPAGNFGNDMFGTSFGTAADRNRNRQRGNTGGGFGGGGGGGF